MTASASIGLHRLAFSADYKTAHGTSWLALTDSPTTVAIHAPHADIAVRLVEIAAQAPLDGEGRVRLVRALSAALRSVEAASVPSYASLVESEAALLDSWADDGGRVA